MAAVSVKLLPRKKCGHPRRTPQRHIANVPDSDSDSGISPGPQRKKSVWKDRNIDSSSAGSDYPGKPYILPSSKDAEMPSSKDAKMPSSIFAEFQGRQVEAEMSRRSSMSESEIQAVIEE